MPHRPERGIPLAIALALLHFTEALMSCVSNERSCHVCAVARGLSYARQNGAAVCEEKWSETPTSGFGSGSGPEERRRRGDNASPDIFWCTDVGCGHVSMSFLVCGFGCLCHAGVWVVEFSWCVILLSRALVFAFLSQ